MSLRYVAAVIPAGGTQSNFVDLDGGIPVGIIVPAAFTGTTLTFNGTYPQGPAAGVAVQDNAGAAVSVTVSPSIGAKLDANTFAAYNSLQVVSGSTEGAKRTLFIAVQY